MDFSTNEMILDNWISIHGGRKRKLDSYLLPYKKSN
jgi:hypothetical protein